ncbi:glycosyltransferase [Mycobacterium phage Huphlepuff]|uniref:Glycosyltransferase n=1 Tax=Mycobacterium phage Corazon TaxID=2652888 RepID=A0A5P8DF67_9CAUD|nr:glycosyltransferase [Mycobacterium phage Corazon]URP22579.1 glycosyltransferase [Mycobacterium phage Huphlepuff]
MTTTGKARVVSKVVMFCFGGRRGNLELQVPFILDILKRHPSVEYHLWDLARDPADSEYMQSLADEHADNPQFVVVRTYSGLKNPWHYFDKVYEHYAGEQYAGKLFVKLDDDVVFIETQRFGEFLATITENSDKIVSAKVVNNGACGERFPEIRAFLRQARYSLLDVHKKPDYAKFCHELFLKNWSRFVGEQLNVIDTTDWLSINLIGYTYEMGCKLNDLIGTPSPRRIAGRFFPHPNSTVGDEGAANMLNRMILNGFTAVHLTFGPQEKRMLAKRWDELRERYAEVGAWYRGDDA